MAKRRGTQRRPALRDSASTELNREFNRDRVLEFLRQHQPVARVELAELSGLRNSTVSIIVDQLLQEGWIREGVVRETTRGRRPTMLTLNTDRIVLAVDIHPGRATLGVVDLNGTILTQSTIALPSGATKALKVLGDALHAMRTQQALKSFEGVGLCIPGRIDLDTGRIVVSPNLHWEGIDCRSLLRAQLDLPVVVENDANASLLSELWFGELQGKRNAVLLAISDGLGAALLTEDYLVRGRKGLAGELGHAPYDFDGPPCPCGKRGCWELYASSKAACAGYQARSRSRVSASYAEICVQAESGNVHAREAIAEQAKAIGRGLRMVTASLAPETILFSGEITAAWTIAEPIVTEECARGLLGGKPPKLLCSRFGSNAQLLGAAAVVWQRHSEYYRAGSVHAGRTT